ncbi:MAG: 1,4-alpha-glucan branching protein GlgB [Clostridiales Family XIII bacterium]|jgi:1,4-alpha-glucan branching enzyme|nr:1,4-alpha-glucan branching protein GlgB [Clostridiales Family XIII bacterium]
MAQENINSYYLDDAEIDAFYAGTSQHAGTVFGSQKVHNLWRFCVWAPNAKSVRVVGDFNSWDENAPVMDRYRGLWVCFVGGAAEGDNYKYRIEGADGAFVMKADPCAVHAETPPGTASKVWIEEGYTWKDADWMAAREGVDALRQPVSIYELHLGSWRIPEGWQYPSYRMLAQKLPKYVKEMGFTHVEIMPVNEHPYGGSWGYQVTGFFAITSRYGTPWDFMKLVDALHAEGIGVIVDWVPAHFPKDEHGLAHFDGSWLYEHENPIKREHPQWGTYQFNYYRPEVRSFLFSSAVNLVENYHVDGIRVDAVSSMLYLDYGRGDNYVRNEDGGNIDESAVAFLRELNTAVLGGRPGVLTVAEESTAFPLVTKPPYDGGLGFTFKWNMGFMHDTLDYMGIDPFFRHGAHEKLTFSMHYAFSENYILPYSHDEVVHGKKSMIDKMFGEYEEKFDEIRTLYGFLYGHPGKKLLFMGNEFAQFVEWDYQKPLDWMLLDYPAHEGVRQWVAALNGLYRGHPAFFSKDDSWDGFQWLNVDDRQNSVIAFLRRGEGAGARGKKKDDLVVCVYNFTPEPHEGYHVALPQAGTLTFLLASTDAKVKKRVKAREEDLNGLPYAAVLTLPPMSALFYKYTVSLK